MLTITTLASSYRIKNRSTSKNKVQTNDWVRPLINTAKSYISFANLPYCPGDIINQLSCPLCSSILDSSFKVFRFHKTTISNKPFTYVLLFSLNRNEVVISFSGPKDLNPEFYQRIYRSGFAQINSSDKTNSVKDLKIENSFHKVFYSNDFENSLRKDLNDYKKLFKATDKNHKFVFVGHNFGGALAVVAAHDLIDQGLISKNDTLDSPIVYSFGALKVGNSAFINNVNKLFRVIRVNKKEDIYTRMAVCDWAPSINQYECNGESYDDQARATRSQYKSTKPELTNYIQSYYGNTVSPALNNAYRGNYGFHSFLENKSKSSLKKKSKKGDGWSYSVTNPGYASPNNANSFDLNGNISNIASMSYSAPLGAEVLFSNNFKNHVVCQYFNGIPTCEGNIPNKFNADVANDYFDFKINEC